MLTNLATYGYLILFFYSLGGGMIALIAAGILSGGGSMNIWLSILIAFGANFLGDSALFYLTRFNKKEILPYLRKQRRNLALSQVLFKKYGSIIILFKKYIYGFKTLVPMAIALTKFSFMKFSILNFISSAIWAVSVGLASFYAGNLIIKFYENNPKWLLPLFLIILILAIYFYFKKATKKQN